MQRSPAHRVTVFDIKAQVFKIELSLVKVDHLVSDMALCTNFDPDFLNMLIQHKVTVIVHMQLVTNRTVPLFFSTYEKINEIVDPHVMPYWSAFIGIPHNLGLALQYRQVIRDMFYLRISFDNLNYPFLKDMAHEAKGIAEKMLQESGKLNG